MSKIEAVCTLVPETERARDSVNDAKAMLQAKASQLRAIEVLWSGGIIDAITVPDFVDKVMYR